MVRMFMEENILTIFSLSQHFSILARGNPFFPFKQFCKIKDIGDADHGCYGFNGGGSVDE